MGYSLSLSGTFSPTHYTLSCSIAIINGKWLDTDGNNEHDEVTSINQENNVVTMGNQPVLASGKLSHNYGKSQCLI